MNSDQDDQRFTGRARAFQRRDTVPAVVAGVGRAGTPVWTEAAGWADLAAERVAQPSTQLRIGSITKTFTAAVVVDLAVRGALDLDEPVEAYLPGVDLGRPRLRQLLAHCGGLQREVPGPMWSSMRGPDATELIKALGQAVPVDRPGVRLHYSNLGYAVLGQVVAAVTGQDCRTVIDAQLLAPLGLSDTTWQPTARAAVGYRKDPYRDGVHVEPVMDQDTVGVGGQLWSTVGDLLTWGDALAGGAPQVLSEAVVEAMHTAQVMVDTVSWTQGWGLGLILTRRGERVTAGHTGAMPGFAAAMGIDRPTRTVTVALANLTRGADVAGLSAELLEEALTAPAPSAFSAGEPWRPGPPCPAEADTTLGRWWCEAEETIFTWYAGSLHAHLAAAPGATRTRFERLGPDSYQAAEGRLRGEWLVVERDPDGTARQLTWATYPYTRDPR